MPTLTPDLIEKLNAVMEHIMTHYADSHFDFTDTAIMALAERLSVARIATFDRRDFAQYRPMHAAHPCTPSI